MNKSAALEILYQQIQAVYPLSPEAWGELSSCWSEIEVKRKQLLTQRGEVEKYLYLVLDGVQRAFYTHEDKEATLIFSYPYSFSGIVDSFLLQKPSKYHLETLTQSRLLRIPSGRLFPLITKHRCIETWIRIALTHQLAGVLERQIELSAFSSTEKFTTLLTRSPHVLNLIPHKYLASYIGVDPATFSKLLATVKL